MVLKVDVATLRFRFAPKVSLKKEIDLIEKQYKNVSNNLDYRNYQDKVFSLLIDLQFETEQLNKHLNILKTLY